MDAKTWMIATYATIGVGLALLVGSYLMPVALPDRTAWSDENAREHAHSAADLHRLTHMHNHGPAGHSHAGEAEATDDKGAAELEAARQRYAASEARLEAAITGRQRLRAIVKWLGIAVAAVGMALAVLLRLNELKSDS